MKIKTEVLCTLSCRADLRLGVVKSGGSPTAEYFSDTLISDRQTELWATHWPSVKRNQISPTAGHMTRRLLLQTLLGERIV